MFEGETQVTTVRVSKTSKPPPPPGPSPSSVEQERIAQLIPDPPLRRPAGSTVAGSSSSPITPSFASNLSPTISPSSPRKFQLPVEAPSPIQNDHQSNVNIAAVETKAVVEDKVTKIAPATAPSSSSSTSPGVGRRPSTLPYKSSPRPKVPAKLLLSGTSTLEHSDKGIIPISELDNHFESLLLPGEWLKIDYKNLRLPPPMMTDKATDFIDDLNSQHRHPIRPYNDPARNS